MSAVTAILPEWKQTRAAELQVWPIYRIQFTKQP